MTLAPFTVRLNPVDDVLIVPMFEHAESEPLWVEMLKAGSMSAPIEPKLRRAKAPCLVTGGRRGESMLQDPTSPVEEMPMSSPRSLLNLSILRINRI